MIMRTKPCGLQVEGVSELTFRELCIHQLFVTFSGITFIKTDYEEAVVLSTGLTQRFGPIKFVGLTESVTHSRMDEPVFKAMFVE
jgi:hypothetical protein